MLDFQLGISTKILCLFFFNFKLSVTSRKKVCKIKNTEDLKAFGWEPTNKIK